MTDRCGPNLTTSIRAGRSTGFSLVEAMVCVFIVGGMLVAALQTAGAARFGQYKVGQRQRGLLLAQELMSEILSQEYAEPVDTAGFGPEMNEGTLSRVIYDDVDDYDGWTSSPPQQKDGTVESSLSDWTRSVEVRYVSEDSYAVTSVTDTGAKRIEVQVSHKGLLVAELWAVRTDNDQQTGDP